MKHPITPDTRLSDIIVACPSSLAILSRFGVRLGVGDATVATASRALHTQPQLVAAILNTSLDPDYSPAGLLPNLDAGQVERYLAATRAHIEHYQLPNIERHFQLLLGSGSNNNLQPMLQFFHQVRQQVLGGGNNWAGSQLDDKVGDLMSMIAIHLQGDCDANLVHAVLQAIGSLRATIAQSRRIASRILQPLQQRSQSPSPPEP